MTASQLHRSEPEHKVHHQIEDPEELARHLQWALSIELSTIPPYLCALYSITDNTSEAYDLIRSVVVEEMLHMALVANLMNAIGAHPSLAAEFVPRYPGHMPHHAAGGPFIQLQPLSAAVVGKVFMPIEQPERSPRAPAEGDRYETLGQFYKAIEEGFDACVERDPDLFARDTGCQRSDLYFGGGGGELFVVHDLVAAKGAISEITQQGEGAPQARPPIPGEEPFGAYEHYGTRLDGTYGPILGTPWELSHYNKFSQLANGDVALPATYPMQANPAAEDLPEALRPLSYLFDHCYTLVLRAIETTFTSPPPENSFFTVAFPLMQESLPLLAALLMQTPLEPDADRSVGPTAGPAFLYRPADASDVLAIAERLLAAPPDFDSDYQGTWSHALQSTIDALGGGR